MQQLNIPFVLAITLRSELPLNDFNCVLFQTFAQLIQLVISIFIINHYCLVIFICNLLFDIKDKVVFFALNLFVDVEQMNVFHVALVEFVVPSWLVY